MSGASGEIMKAVLIKEKRGVCIVPTLPSKQFIYNNVLDLVRSQQLAPTPTVEKPVEVREYEQHHSIVSEKGIASEEKPATPTTQVKLAFQTPLSKQASAASAISAPTSPSPLPSPASAACSLVPGASAVLPVGDMVLGDMVPAGTGRGPVLPQSLRAFGSNVLG
jgi:hypothetical protein